MENLNINGTKSTPDVFFNVNGRLAIKGRILADNAVNSFKPLYEWISDFNNDKVIFDIHVDYMNTSASMQLFGLLKILDDNTLVKSFIVNWHYEEDDDDHFETGQFFKDRLTKAEFHFFVESDMSLMI